MAILIQGKGIRGRGNGKEKGSQGARHQASQPVLILSVDTMYIKRTTANDRYRMTDETMEITMMLTYWWKKGLIKPGM